MLANLTDRIEILLESNSVMRIGLLFAARAFNPVVSLAFSLLAGMYLTVEDHGIYGLTLARIFVMQAFMEAGLQQSLVRFLAPALKKNDPDEIHSIIRASIQLKLYVLGAGVVATLVYILALVNASTLAALGVPAEWLPGARLENLYLAWLILTGGFALSLMTYLDSVLVSHESFVKLLFWLPMVGFLRLSLMGYFLIFNEHALRAEHIIYAFVIGTVIAVLFYFTIFYADFFFVKVPRRIWKPWTKRLLQFNTWIILASFMAILSDWMEVLLIDRSGDLGLFNAARLPMQGFMIILTTMVSFLL
ncbi:MAG: hypothetical protein KDK34_22985, partial [Leptospiraceae bacterium]|nr:hypothetical protein [Leptospiraceae bacterium]